MNRRKTERSEYVLLTVEKQRKLLEEEARLVELLALVKKMKNDVMLEQLELDSLMDKAVEQNSARYRSRKRKRRERLNLLAASVPGTSNVPSNASARVTGEAINSVSSQVETASTKETTLNLATFNTLSGMLEGHYENYEEEEDDEDTDTLMKDFLV